MRRVNVIAHQSSRLFKLALATSGCVAIPRGQGDSGLKQALGDLALPADLTVVAAHGSTDGGTPWIGSSNKATASWVAFTPDPIGAANLVLAMCSAGEEPYLKQVREVSTNTRLVGPEGVVLMTNLAAFSIGLVTSFLAGSTLDAAFAHAQAASPGQADRWRIH